MMRFFQAVLGDFFGLQWSVKLKLKRVPVIPVDNPLDAAVPFKPEKAPVYADFINYWIRSLSMYISLLGRPRGLTRCAEFLALLGRAYREAARVYRFRMSTTFRPKTRSPLVRAIRGLDPHLLCVPSLHVAIVTLTWSFCRSLFAQEPPPGISPEEARRILEQLRTGALEITETVLYIKQHSVNCIPAALYMVTSLAPELFSINDAVEFAGSLFAEAGDILPADQHAIRAHILFLFERLLLEGAQETDWAAPVKRWLLGVEKA
jgi:hypothetical protein